MELKQLKNELIYKSFPSLKRSWIVFIKISSDSMFMGLLKIQFIPIGIILVDKECFKMNKLAITGCLAHELAHMAYPKLNEREIDQKVIDLGYGKELLEFIKYHDKYFENYSKEDGLTRKEVKRQVSKEK